ncbi:alpha-hydroxy-acid oxidizing protein [Xenorhabdus bovienii]|uniref:Alpha-hydroxy-acid oxidizing protein n=1 Tax=Xenorhabdus bovienii TaxID=40576 RepID=A0AAJ1J3J8_XENBV|nr:alpha-hydroxy-acid oxidizing protein [Xenorhabdus bovienii]MDE1476879.1 alpha-hydroxy-acid oxidizing protein [Xenorhabdus bovienii]MDE1485106.1 alpha-hydroxy-acid oxidizing protein [Xenorhabdus bovienii]MDE1494201.1 alpha-hydroxy-acid oxidizing protein [Xenorhabdus bovienii]MDE9430266.1 alpha-hydroxy-acid oxidizing protein [Xenorhabdus bovienii]MDE9444931.1 alpha-hydroxy-acid oxidizing protein [Xenorhabdus bovienii]
MSNRLINVADYRTLAKKKLPKIIFDYLEGGAEDEKGLTHNQQVFDRWRFIPYRLTDVSKRDVSCSLFNKVWSVPFAIAPTGLNAIFRPNGDLILAKIAEKENIPFILSSAANMTIEDVATHCDGEKWFQLYVVHLELAKQLIKRALAADYTTLIITVDVAVNGYRERDIRNQFCLPLRYRSTVLLDGCLHPSWLLRFLRNGMPQLANFVTSENVNSDIQAAMMNRQMDASFNWQSLEMLRALWPHKLLVKGIIRLEDAKKCVELGADGVILSNHGGRQLDSILSPMETLQDIVQEIGQPILIDSGFRRGSDIVKALALGANMVLLGRAVLYGLAAAGEQGVSEVIRLLKEDIERTLAHIGSPSVRELTPNFVHNDTVRR